MLDYRSVTCVGFLRCYDVWKESMRFRHICNTKLLLSSDKGAIQNCQWNQMLINFGETAKNKKKKQMPNHFLNRNSVFNMIPLDFDRSVAFCFMRDLPCQGEEANSNSQLYRWPPLALVVVWTTSDWPWRRRIMPRVTSKQTWNP